jgi:hypothetical protein
MQSNGDRDRLISSDDKGEFLLIPTMTGTSSVVHAILGAVSTRYQDFTTTDDQRIVMASEIREYVGNNVLTPVKKGLSVWELVYPLVYDAKIDENDIDGSIAEYFRTMSNSPLLLSSSLLDETRIVPPRAIWLFAETLKVNIHIFSRIGTVSHVCDKSWNNILIYQQKDNMRYNTIGYKSYDSKRMTTLFCPDQVKDLEVRKGTDKKSLRQQKLFSKYIRERL